MADAITVELQAVSGALHLAKRAMDDVVARVTRDPGPQQDPAKLALLADIITTSQAIGQEAQQVQTAIGGSGPGPAPSP